MQKQKSSRNRRMNMQNSLENQTSDLPSSVATTTESENIVIGSSQSISNIQFIPLQKNHER